MIPRLALAGINKQQINHNPLLLMVFSLSCLAMSGTL